MLRDDTAVASSAAPLLYNAPALSVKILHACLYDSVCVLYTTHQEFIPSALACSHRDTEFTKDPA